MRYDFRNQIRKGSTEGTEFAKKKLEETEGMPLAGN